MFKIVDIVERHVTVEGEVAGRDSPYAVDVMTSDLPDEDAIPCPIGEGAVALLNEDGYFGEIECISPTIVETAACTVSADLTTRSGVPKLAYVREKVVVTVEVHETTFTIWLAQGRVVDQKIIVAPNLTLLVVQDELVGMTAGIDVRLD